MQVSKWEINKIGLIDFWYYDEEEFQFIDGRLLLRGANGSGKSVTMQSFIPLLLDGNKASERLDPFGTKARKLENYLLEENDDRQERTGYLYMEFKRKESDSYLTIGIGLCARKNKKLSAWHFVITDGRRIGKEFFLYKNMKEKITLSKQELIFRLGEGGEVIEGQKEYMKMVNDKLFGYETVEEYKELVDLLIQLRTPKLSKDFKPTVLNEILSSSLPPLSDEDLRPMSEAIENMDNLKAQLEKLEESRKASEKILETYNQYNRCVLYEKAKRFTQAEEDYINMVRELENLEQAQRTGKEKLELEQKKIIELQIEEDTLKKQKEDLDKNDVAQLMEKKQKMEIELKGLKQQKEDKEKQLEQKRELEIQENTKKKEKEAEGEIKLQEIKEQLEEMEEGLSDISFDEHEFMAAELLEHVEEPYSFAGIHGQLDKVIEYVKSGIGILERKEKVAERLEEKQVEKEKIVNEKEQKERERELLLQQSEQVKEEWLENFYQWIRNNQQLYLTPEIEQNLVTIMNQFNIDSEFAQIKEPIRQKKEEKRSQLWNKTVILHNEIEKVKEEQRELEAVLKGWIEKKDPEPERDMAVTKNRKWLQEQGIPYEPLYKVIDFEEKVSKEQRNRLEEALLYMGLLDAIIVPDNYQERVMEYREGMRDTYLFTSSNVAKKAIHEFLEVSLEQDDIVFYQEVSSILKSIGTVEGGTVIHKDGSFMQGLLNGTLSGEYECKFIGGKAREAFKQEQIRIIADKVKEKEIKVSDLEKQKMSLERKQEVLEEEFEALPKEDDVKLAVKELYRVEQEVEKNQLEIETITVEIKKIQEELKEIQLEVAVISRKVYLKADFTVFKNAGEELENYKKELLKLENIHEGYIHCREMYQTYENQLETILTDMDHLRYDLNRFEIGIKSYVMQIQQCQEQLELEDYETIKNKIAYCMQRFLEIPEERKESMKQQGILEERLTNLEQSQKNLETKRESQQGKLQLMQHGFEDEAALGYVETIEEQMEKTSLQKAKHFQKILWQGNDKTSLDMAGSLQERYHKYKGEMSEFGLVLKYLFIKEEYEKYGNNMESGFRRLDILGKYKGKEVAFPVLVQGLKDDVEIQKNLVKESDRSLFEDILAHTISKKIRLKIYNSEKWVDNMNCLMSSMNTSSGLKLNLIWKKKKAEEEGQLDTGKLVELLKKDAGIMREEEIEKLSMHFQSKVEEARRRLSDTGNTKSFHGIMKEVLDYRTWFEFQLFYEKTGEKKKELTNHAFFTFSGGEKAMSMYVPLFSAVVAKYQGARTDAPRLVSLDEAFAGVDDTNIRDMFRLMVELDFEFIINSQILWGDCDTVPSLAIYQLLRPANAKYVSVLPYKWNGKVRQVILSEG